MKKIFRVFLSATLLFVLFSAVFSLVSYYLSGQQAIVVGFPFHVWRRFYKPVPCLYSENESAACPLTMTWQSKASPFNVLFNFAFWLAIASSIEFLKAQKKKRPYELKKK